MHEILTLERETETDRRIQRDRDRQADRYSQRGRQKSRETETGRQADRDTETDRPTDRRRRCLMIVFEINGHQRWKCFKSKVGRTSVRLKSKSHPYPPTPHPISSHSLSRK